ncbi:hypothetical protein MVEN_00671700 [Mycena venus]|uniref:Uncharacterized protein n=1 Tax=Mycena venus TaxID=2733690 RepID=A0A8H7D911_9AGAR|nr:hypothetical protein MVEN_00671700 [Mycena venus]
MFEDQRPVCSGKDLALDGFVRMEMDFYVVSHIAKDCSRTMRSEVVLCDFSDCVELFADFLASWRSRALYHPSDDQTHTLPFTQIPNRRPASLWTLRIPMISPPHGTTATPSLISQRHGIEHRDHRVARIFKRDLTEVRMRMSEIFVPRRPDAQKRESGVGWQTVSRVISDRIEYLLNTMTSINVDEPVKIIQRQLQIMLTPYILHSARANPPLDAVADDSCGESALNQAHNPHPQQQPTSIAPDHVGMTTRRALDETNHQMCRVVLRM